MHKCTNNNIQTTITWNTNRIRYLTTAHINNQLVDPYLTWVNLKLAIMGKVSNKIWVATHNAGKQGKTRHLISSSNSFNSTSKCNTTNHLQICISSIRISYSHLLTSNPSSKVNFNQYHNKPRAIN